MADSPETGSDDVVGVSIKMNGTEIPDDTMLLSVRIVNSINRIPEAVVVMQTGSIADNEFPEVDDDKYALGAEIEIQGFYGSATGTTLFKGVVYGRRMRVGAGDGPRFEMTCRDKAMVLTEVRSDASYAEKKDSEIISAIVKDAGLTATVTATTATFPSQLRIASTDWDFVRLLADRNGMVVMIDGGKLTVAEPDDSVAAVLTVTLGVDILDFDLSVDAQRMIADATTTSWSEASQSMSTGASSALKDSSLGNTKSSAIAKAIKDRSLTTATAREFEAADLKTFSDARVTRATLGTLNGSISFIGSGKIKPLDTLEVTGASKTFGGTGLVTAVEHEFKVGEWTTKTRFGFAQDWTSDTSGLAEPSAAALSTPMHGLQIGKVLNVAEDPDGKQRIQITLPAIGDPAAEVWARYATPYASAEAGIQFLPEVDDEVVVAFLNADPDAPIIVGSLHNAKAKRPETETTDNYIKTIVTPEKLKMTFDDEKKIITVETPGGHKLTMDDDASKFSMEDMNGNSIVMDTSGIALKTDMDITLTATGNITAEATQDATVNGMNVTCEGQVGFTGKGGATAEVSAGGTTKVEGAMVTIN